MGIDEVLAFLETAAAAEHLALRGQLGEPDDKKFIALVRAWDAMFAGDIRSGLGRALGRPPAYYKRPKYVKAAAAYKPRTIFAIARYRQGKRDLYRAWMGLTEVGVRGEGFLDNYYVASVAGALKIVARYRACLTCFGAGKTKGKACAACNGGWNYEDGKRLNKLGAPLEVRKLVTPSDPLSKPAYAAIDPAR